MKQYQDIVKLILESGNTSEDRTGAGTISKFGMEFRHNMRDGFPLITTKKMHFPSIVGELIWFLNGSTQLKELLDLGVNIWNGDFFKMYQTKNPASSLTLKEFIFQVEHAPEFAKLWGDGGPLYGKQWRAWETGELVVVKQVITPTSSYMEYGNVVIDQIQNLINDLKSNPSSRRLLVNAWRVDAIPQMVLPPCHYGFECYTRKLTLEERVDIYLQQHPTWGMIFNHRFMDEHNIPAYALSLKWNQRSVDVALGLPFNIASYGLLLLLFCKVTNMIPEELIGSFGNTHIYLPHVEAITEQLQSEPFPLPTVQIIGEIPENLKGLEKSNFTLEGYQSHNGVKFQLFN